MTSKITKKYKVKYYILTFFSWVLVTGPLLYYSFFSFIKGENHEKATLGIAVVAAVLLTVVSIVFKFNIRSTIFILILGIYFCLDDILNLIIAISACTIIDEFIVSPLKKIYKTKMIINKEIDKRG